MILALDCATRTGWSLIDDGAVIESGVLDLSKRRGESNGAMFLRFRAWLLEIQRQWPQIKLFAYEQAHHRGGAATEVCVNLTGRVQETSTALGIDLATVHTATLKKFATGSGVAKKPEMILAASKRIGRVLTDDNEADAVLIGLWAWENYKT